MQQFDRTIVAIQSTDTIAATPYSGARNFGKHHIPVEIDRDSGRSCKPASDHGSLKPTASNQHAVEVRWFAPRRDDRGSCHGAGEQDRTEKNTTPGRIFHR
jgi:hypothetical protein